MNNKYPGRCAKCHVYIPAGKGYYVQGRVLCAEHHNPGPSTHIARRLDSDGAIHTPYDPNALPLLRSFPGARWDGLAKVWRVSTSDSDLPRVLELAGRLALEVAPELLARRAELALAHVKEMDALPAHLYPHQREGIVFLRAHSHALLADEMGLGKTAQCLLALPPEARAVVICPASLKGTWREETRTWRPDLVPVVLKGRKSFRLPEPGEVVIVNYDILPTLKAIEALQLSNIQIIIDEATAVKSYKAKRTKACRALVAKARGCWLVTGTPLLGRPLDLWGVLGSGGLDRLVFGGWNGFVRDFGGHKNKWGGWEFKIPGPQVAEKLRRVMVRRRKSEVLTSLPPKVHRSLPVNDLAATPYADEAWDEWGDVLECDELPPFEELSRARAELAAAKIPAMLELVEQHEDAEESLVVFSAYRAPVDALASREGWATITGDVPAEERSEIVARFQAGELKGVALTIAAGGYGLTLTRASHCLFVDLDWTPSANVQAEDRLHRIGQGASSVQYSILVAEHPIDRRVTELLAAKARLIAAAVDASPIVVTAATKSTPSNHETLLAEAVARREAAEKAEAEQTRRERARRLDRACKYSSRLGGGVAQALRPGNPEQLRKQLAFLVDVCDGAITKDGQGFSKVDAWAGRAIFAALDNGAREEEIVLAATRLAIRYCRQLKEAELW